MKELVDTEALLDTKLGASRRQLLAGGVGGIGGGRSCGSNRCIFGDYRLNSRAGTAMEETISRKS